MLFIDLFLLLEEEGFASAVIRSMNGVFPLRRAAVFGLSRPPAPIYFSAPPSGRDPGRAECYSAGERGAKTSEEEESAEFSSASPRTSS